MTQEDKDLLLQDVCVRLPYGVKASFCDVKKEYISIIEGIDIYKFIKDDSGIETEISDVKPYLFPLSSMTEEQSKVYHELIGGMFGTNTLINFEILTDFFNANHLDYRSLIEKGLAIDATNLNIY